MTIKGFRLGRVVSIAIGGLVLVSAGALSISGITSQRLLHATIDIYEESRGADMLIRELTALQKDVEISIISTQESLTDISATQAKDGLDDGFELASQEVAKVDRYIERIGTLGAQLSTPELTPAMARLRGRYLSFYDAGVAMANAYIAGGVTEGNKQMGAFDQASDDLQAEIEAMGSVVAKIIESKDRASSAGIDRAKLDADAMAWMLAALGAMGVVAGAALAYFVSLRLLKPLGQATEAMNGLADGNVDIVLKGDDRADEIGDLARAFSNFRQNLLEGQKSRLEEERGRARMKTIQDMNDLERAAELERTKTAVDAVADALDLLAKGDLTARIERALEGQYERLRENFNESAARLQAVMGGISEISHGVQADAREMRASADDLARRTEQQAAALEQTAAALSQVNAGMLSTATIAQGVGQKVDSASKRAEQSDGIVRRAIEAMSHIENSSTQISTIISVIDEIAFQTNLLALNAGVEAARAGDAGKGFAVVAQEVRALAQRSANAAREIAELIQRSGAAVSSGVSLVNQTGEILAIIQGNVREINEDIGRIVTGTQEQSSGLNEINGAIAQMDQVTQQNAAMVEETTAAVHRLATEADELFRQVGQFRTETGRMAFDRAA